MALKLYFKIKNFYFCVNKLQISPFKNLDVMNKLFGILLLWAVS